MAKENQTEDEDVATVDDLTETAEAPQITLQQVAQVVEIVDLCSARGAFKGAELEAVGQLRNVYARFVEANQPPTAPTDGDEDASETEE